MSVDKLIGKRIQEARSAVNLSEDALAAALAIDVPTLKLLEAGKMRIGAKFICQLSKCLNQEIRWFFEADAQPGGQAEPTNTGIRTAVIKTGLFAERWRLNKTLESLCEMAADAQYGAVKTSNAA